MENEELIKETNSLLRYIVEMDERHKQEMEEFQQESDREREAHKRQMEEWTSGRLRSAGFTEDEIGGGNWEDRMKALHEKSQERLQTSLELDRKYKDDLIAELREQTELMRQIAGALRS